MPKIPRWKANVIRRYGVQRALERQAIAQNRRTKTCLRCGVAFEFSGTLALLLGEPDFCVSCTLTPRTKPTN